MFGVFVVGGYIFYYYGYIYIFFFGVFLVVVISSYVDYLIGQFGFFCEFGFGKCVYVDDGIVLGVVYVVFGFGVELGVFYVDDCFFFVENYFVVFYGCGVFLDDC